MLSSISLAIINFLVVNFFFNASHHFPQRYIGCIGYVAAFRQDHYDEVRCNDELRTYSRLFQVTYAERQHHGTYPHLMDYTFVLQSERKDDFGCNMFLNVRASTTSGDSALGTIHISEMDRTLFNVSLQLYTGKEWTVRIVRECDASDPELSHLHGLSSLDHTYWDWADITRNRLALPVYITIPAVKEANFPETLCNSTCELTHGHYTLVNQTQPTWRPNTCSIPTFDVQILQKKWFVFIGDSTIQELALNVAAIVTETGKCLHNILSYRPTEKFTHTGFMDCPINMTAGKKQIKVKNLLNMRFSALAQKCTIPYMQWRDVDLEWQGARVTWIWLGGSGPCLNDIGLESFEAPERKQRIASLYKGERKPDYLVLNSGLHDLVRRNFRLTNYSAALSNIMASLQTMDTMGETKMIWKTTTATGKASRCPRTHGSERGTGAVRLLNEESTTLARRFNFTIMDVFPLRSLRSADGDGHHCNADPSCIAQVSVFLEMIRISSRKK